MVGLFCAMSEQPSVTPAPESFVVIRFEQLGSVVFNSNIQATPLQLLAVAAWLEVRAKNMLVQEENRRAEEEAQRTIARPKLVLPDK